MASIKGDLGTNQLAAVHSQYNTAKKHDPALAEEYQQLNKVEKGKAALGWYLSKVTGGRFQGRSQSVRSGQTATKVEQWLSEKETETRFGHDDMQKHIASGRIVWRECPGTREVYEYQDTQDIKVEKQISKEKTWTQQQEEEKASLEDINDFDGFFDSFISGPASSGMFLDTSDVGMWLATCSGKGGPAGGKGAGKGKGKNGKDPKPADPPLSLEDMSEEDKILDIQGKSKKMLNLLQQCMVSCQEIEGQVKQSKYFSKAMENDAKEAQASLNKYIKKCKDYVMGKNIKGSEAMKQTLLESANILKKIAGMIRDLKAIMSKGADGQSACSKISHKKK